MSNPILIELNRNNASFQDPQYNSIYECQLKAPVVVEDGDQLIMRNAFVDVQQASGSDVVVENDTTLSLTFGYYEVNYDFTDKTREPYGPEGVADFKYYVLYQNTGDSQTLSGLSWDCSAIDLVNFPLNYFANISYTTKDGIVHTKNQIFISINPSTGNANPCTATIDNIDDVVVGSVVLLNKNDEEFISNYLTFNGGVYSGAPTELGTTLATGTKQILIEKGNYDSVSLAKKITDGMSYLTPWDGSKSKSSSDNPFIIQTTALNILYEVGELPSTQMGYSYDVPYWIGATQASLVYGQDGRQIFAFEYLHTPFLDNSNEVVMIGKDLNNGLWIVPQPTGIFLIDVQPASFWEQLGFDLSTSGNGILCNLKYPSPPDPTIPPIVPSAAELERVITKAYTGIQDVLLGDASGKRKVAQPASNPFYLDVSTTLMLEANDRDLDETGHYLVEITFEATGQTYVYNTGSLSHIFGILSKQYISDGFITGFEDSGIPYTHQGLAFQLQSFRVRILDPTTKEPVNTLGQNTSLYLELVKGNKEKKSLTFL